MTDRITPSHGDYRLSGTLARLELGSAPATLELVEGVKATVLGDASEGTGTVCAIITLPKPCGVIVAHELSITPPANSPVIASGTPNYARWRDGNGVVVMDSDVGSLASSNSVRISPTTLTAGAEVHVATCVLR